MAKEYLTPKDKEEIFKTSNYINYKKYLKSKRVKGISERSLVTYYSYFTHFLKFLHEHDRFTDIDLYSDEFYDNAVDIMEDFMVYLQEDCGLHKKVINTKISAVSSFFEWSVKRKIIKAHPFSGKLDRMKNAKEEKIRKSQWLTQEQIDTVKRELQINNKYDLQDQVLFSLVIDSGNRVGAIHQITLSKLNVDEMVVEDIIEKGNKNVEIVFEDEDTQDLIREWLDARKDGYDRLTVDALFITYYKNEWKPMSYGTIQSRFSRIGKDILGLERFGMHDGRKTKANLLYEETGDLTMAQRWLNHNEVSTTLSHYIKPASKADLRNSVREKRALKEKQIKELKE